MTPLAIIVVGPEAGRAAAALGIASAAAALGRDVALLFDGVSVGTLAGLADTLATTLALGVAVTACATGLADRGVAPPAGVATGGVIAFLAANAGAELVAV